jgi:hypothetical protein
MRRSSSSAPRASRSRAARTAAWGSGARCSCCRRCAAARHRRRRHAGDHLEHRRPPHRPSTCPLSPDPRWNCSRQARRPRRWRARRHTSMAHSTRSCAGPHTRSQQPSRADTSHRPHQRRLNLTLPNGPSHQHRRGGLVHRRLSAAATPTRSAIAVPRQINALRLRLTTDRCCRSQTGFSGSQIAIGQQRCRTPRFAGVGRAEKALHPCERCGQIRPARARINRDRYRQATVSGGTFGVRSESAEVVK